MCRPRRVGGLQRLVVGVVDVASRSLALEVLERGQEEVALVLERLERRRVERRRAISLGHGHLSRSACSTSARSASLASDRGVRRHRAKVADSAASASTSPSTGRLQTSPSMPDPETSEDARVVKEWLVTVTLRG